MGNRESLALMVEPETALANDVGEVTAVSWQPHHDLSFEQWESVGNTLQQIGASLNWWIGDWLNYGEAKWGEMYAQAIEVTGWEYQRLAQAKYVASNVQFLLRNKNLSWSKHKEIAKLEPDEQAEWLELAEINNWSTRELRDHIRASQEPTRIGTISETTIHENGNGYHDFDDDVPFNHQTRWDVSDEERTPVDEYEQQDEQILVNQPSSMDIHYSSDTAEHYTPQIIVDAAIECMGFIDLDPCSNSHERPNVPAKYHFTADDDGLDQEWYGRVYMNPPYGREIGAWVGKLINSHKHGMVDEAIALVPARTDTQWFMMLRDYPVCFIEGRLKFVGNDDPAPFPSAVFYLGSNLPDFFYAFNDLGDIWQRIESGMFGE